MRLGTMRRVMPMLLAITLAGGMAAVAKESHATSGGNQDPIKAVAKQDHAAYMAQRKATRATFQGQMRQERGQFLASLKGQGLTPEQKQAALEQFKQQQQTKRQAFREEQNRQYAQWKEQERGKVHGLRQERREARKTERAHDAQP